MAGKHHGEPQRSTTADHRRPRPARRPRRPCARRQRAIATLPSRTRPGGRPSRRNAYTLAEVYTTSSASRRSMPPISMRFSDRTSQVDVTKSLASLEAPLWLDAGVRFRRGRPARNRHGSESGDRRIRKHFPRSTCSRLFVAPSVTIAWRSVSTCARVSRWSQTGPAWTTRDRLRRSQTWRPLPERER